MTTATHFWSWRQELNLQPADYKSAALPLSHASIGCGEWDSNPRPSAYEADELPTAPSRNIYL